MKVYMCTMFMSSNLWYLPLVCEVFITIKKLFSSFSLLVFGTLKMGSVVPPGSVFWVCFQQCSNKHMRYSGIKPEILACKARQSLQLPPQSLIQCFWEVLKTYFSLCVQVSLWQCSGDHIRLPGIKQDLTVCKVSTLTMYYKFALISIFCYYIHT